MLVGLSGRVATKASVSSTGSEPRSERSNRMTLAGASAAGLRKQCSSREDVHAFALCQ
jgi:hypothetical protein